jgi:NAD(P)-dependent dehydrogenase (short-subunit alcohol dehydrogenase family)
LKSAPVRSSFLFFSLSDHPLDVLFFGPIALTQQLLRQLRASRGRVINVTSIGGIMPGPMIAAYQAARAAFEAVSDSMQIEFSPFGVYVSAIARGSISTLMLNRSPTNFTGSRRPTRTAR